MKNYYVILGVDLSASDDEIKRAYKNLAIKYHPDRNPDNLQAEEKFKDIAEAHKTFTNPMLRLMYDAKFTSEGTGMQTDCKQCGGTGYIIKTYGIFKTRQGRFPCPNCTKHS